MASGCVILSGSEIPVSRLNEKLRDDEGSHIGVESKALSTAKKL
jgi:hypothetical protein